jgi:rhodanese-related sulfurtransferase
VDHNRELEGRETSTTLAGVLAPAEVARLDQQVPGLRLLDVRTPGEFASEHIRGAYNVPLETLGEHAREIRASGESPLVLVCRSGQRARKAEVALKAAGLEHLHVLDGGMAAWVAAGFPVERGRHTMSLERQVRIAAGTLAAIGGLLAALLHPVFGWLSTLVGGGLVFAGITDTCGMAMLLARLPHNRPATCDVGVALRALSERPADAAAREPAPSRACCG